MSGITLTEIDDATIATPASGKATVFLDDTIGPAYKDDTGTVTSLIGAAAPALTYLDHGNTGATETVTVSAGDVQRLVADSATVTLTLAGWAASGTPDVVRLILTQDATGGRDWVFPGAVTWGVAGSPVWTTRAANAIDIVDLETVDGGTIVTAMLAGRAGPPSGGAISIEYTFSTTTTDADPGSGALRLSSATMNASTVIRADLVDVNGTTRTTTLDALDDSTNTVKGHLRLFKTSDPTKWILWTLTSIASPSGYRNLTVVPIDSSATSPFANGDPLTLSFVQAGDVGASGTASVGTDPIWDAAGDLAVGSGADTAARLAKGAAGGALTIINAAVAWNSGTSFPGSKATGDRYWRTDLGQEYFWDGTQWVTTTLYREGFFVNDSVIGAGFATDSTVGLMPVWAAEAIYLDKLYVSYRTGATNTGSAYWTYKLRRRDSAGTGTDIVSATTAADTTNTWFAKSHSIAAVMNAAGLVLDVQALKTSTPTALPLVFALSFRLIAT